MNRSDKIKLISENIRTYPDFPQTGVLFRDIFSVFNKPQALTALYDVIKEDCQSFSGKVDAVCALDARGFLFGPHIAQLLEIPFVPIRKKGKLPGKIASVKYELEYGSDELEIQADSLKGGNVILVDDLLATGGSLKAAGSLVESLGCHVKSCFVIVELVGLNGRSVIPYPVHSILYY